MNELIPSIGVHREHVIFSDTIKSTLIQNAVYSEYKMMAFFEDILEKSYDVASFFEHSNGQKYCVVHSIFGINYNEIYENKINNSDWSVSITTPKHMREFIKTYITEHKCSDQYVFCIADEENGNESSEDE